MGTDIRRQITRQDNGQVYIYIEVHNNYQSTPIFGIYLHSQISSYSPHSQYVHINAISVCVWYISCYFRHTLGVESEEYYMHAQQGLQ